MVISAENKKKVLVVDDMNVCRKQIKDFLGNSLITLEAKNAIEAVKVAKEEKPWVVILDYIIPKGSGLHVIKAFQDDSELRYTPIVVMSGSRDEVIRNISEPLEEKGLVFLEKPFSRDQLLKSLKRAFAVIRKKEIEDSKGAPKPTPDELIAKVLRLEQIVLKQQKQINFLLSKLSQSAQ
jgi:Response regulator containing CheY-like receiver, AAA-type ATPase, and DNA-binding domains